VLVTMAHQQRIRRCVVYVTEGLWFLFSEQLLLVSPSVVTGACLFRVCGKSKMCHLPFIGTQVFIQLSFPLDMPDEEGSCCLSRMLLS